MCLSVQGSAEADNLACTYEEADKRMLLHAMDADFKFQDTEGRIIITTTRKSAL